MKFDRKGLMLVLSSPSGAGKTSLCKKIVSSDKNIILSVNLNEDLTEVANEFLYVFEQFLKHVLFDDFDKFTKYYNLVISNQLQKNEAFQINKELDIKKVKDRFYI